MRMSLLFGPFLLFGGWILSGGSGFAWGAACCASGGAIPTMITGDEAALVSASAAQGLVIGDAPPSGRPVFRNRDHDELTRSTRIKGALVFGDRFQVGAGVSFQQHTVSRTFSHSRAYGVGDTQAMAAYEYLPEWTYSSWKPKGFVFGQVIAPTGRSVYEARERSAIDATGRGFWQAGLGNVFVKRWSSWDAFLLADLIVLSGL